MSSPPRSSPQAAPIPESDRIPMLQKIMFSIGMNTDYIATGLMTGVLWMPYFNIGLGISPALLGVVLMILRAWDAISDPVMGNITDNARTRWGRRRPFLVLGAILAGCFYPLFWYMPAGMSEAGKVVYLIVVGVLFFSAYTIWSMPYYSLQLELTPNYDERTRLASWMAVFSKISALIGGWALAFLTSSLFINPDTGKGDIVIGMKTGCWIIAASIIAFGLLPAFFVKEKMYEAEASRQPRESVWTSIKESSRLAPLWSLIGISFFLVLGTISVGTLNQYLNIYYVHRGDLSAASVVAGWKTTVIVMTGILSIPLWTWLSERLDKQIMVIGMLVLSILGHLLNYLLMTPLHPLWQIIPAVFESSAYSALWLFLPSMKADTADYDELATSRRREGSINSFYSWFIKASLTCSMGLGGAVLEISGFDARHGEQPPEVLHSMMLLFLFIPVIIWGAAIVIACFYPLNRQRMTEIRRELERRRGAIQAA